MRKFALWALFLLILASYAAALAFLYQLLFHIAGQVFPR
jgi:hypothetical protein